jgi:hypothetical protein
VFLADGNDDNAAGLLVHLVKNPMVSARPDSELVFTTGDLVVAPRTGVLLQFQNRPSNPQKGVVVQLEQFTPRGPSEPDLRLGVF